MQLRKRQRSQFEILIYDFMQSLSKDYRIRWIYCEKALSVHLIWIDCKILAIESTNEVQ